jgi:hypothetical protein
MLLLCIVHRASSIDEDREASLVCVWTPRHGGGDLIDLARSDTNRHIVAFIDVETCIESLFPYYHTDHK